MKRPTAAQWVWVALLCASGLLMAWSGDPAEPRSGGTNGVIRWETNLVLVTEGFYQLSYFDTDLTPVFHARYEVDLNDCITSAEVVTIFTPHITVTNGVYTITFQTQ